jgi:hypothetical protein
MALESILPTGPAWRSSFGSSATPSPSNSQSDSRQAFVDIPPGGFRGRAHELFAPGGNSYAIVSDGRSFVVVRTTEAWRWHGKAITVARDAKGTPVLREAPDRGRT